MPVGGLACAVWLGLGASVGVRAEDWDHRGLLRSRDLTPFGLLRLDLLPTDMYPLARGDRAVELALSYQNTFVMSPNVESYLRQRDVGRVPLRPEDVAAIFAQPDDGYYVDGEVGLYDFIAHWSIGERWHIHASLPYIRYGRGVFDGVIESFHDAFGFSQMGRDLVDRSRFQFVYRVDDDRVSLLDRPTRGGFGDPVFGLQYEVPLADPAWKLVLEGAVKVAIDGQRLLLSTGEHDVGVQGTVRRISGRHAVHASASVVYFQGSRSPPDDHSQLIPTLIAGWSYALSPRTSVIVQGYASRSTVRYSSVRELTDDKYQLSFGWQTRRGHTLLDFAITENVGNFRNTPDVGVQVGITRLIPAG